MALLIRGAAFALGSEKTKSARGRERERGREIDRERERDREIEILSAKEINPKR